MPVYMTRALRILISIKLLLASSHKVWTYLSSLVPSSVKEALESWTGGALLPAEICVYIKLSKDPCRNMVFIGDLDSFSYTWELKNCHWRMVVIYKPKPLRQWNWIVEILALQMEEILSISIFLPLQAN